MLMFEDPETVFIKDVSNHIRRGERNSMRTMHLFIKGINTSKISYRLLWKLNVLNWSCNLLFCRFWFFDVDWCILEPVNERSIIISVLGSTTCGLHKKWLLPVVKRLCLWDIGVQVAGAGRTST
jgi:hypothetical protein